MGLAYGFKKQILGSRKSAVCPDLYFALTSSMVLRLISKLLVSGQRHAEDLAALGFDYTVKVYSLFVI